MTELEMLPANTYSPQLYRIILKFLTYFLMYIIVPISVYNYVIDPMILLRISSLVNYAKEVRILLILLVIYLYYKTYKRAASILFGRLHFNLKNEWLNYLTFNGWKIGYYKELSFSLNSLNKSISAFSKYIFDFGNLYMLVFKASVFLFIFFPYFLIGCRICAHYQKSMIGFDVWKSGILLNYVEKLNIELVNLIVFLFSSLIITSFILLMLGIFLSFISLRLIQCVFPTTEDSLDVPISFIKEAIKRLESFNFSGSFRENQDRKNQITQLISYSLDFYIKVDNGSDEPYDTNFCFPLWAGHISKAARDDILFRTNGLYHKIDDLCVKVNHMKCPDDKIVILQDLTMYLEMIENRDLSRIEALPYEIKESSLDDLFVRGISFLGKVL